MPNLLHRLKINEVSSCKRGAGEGVKVVMMKIDRDDKRPDGQPFIKANTSLVWFMKTAIEMGAPIAAVAKAEVAMNASIAEIEKIPETEQLAALETSLSQCVEHLVGLVPQEKVDDFKAEVSAVTQESNMPTEAEKAAIAKAEKEQNERYEKLEKSNAALTRQVSILSMSKEHQEYLPVMPVEATVLVAEQDKFIAATPEQRDETMKAFPPKKKKPVEACDDDMGKTIEKAIAESPLVKSLVKENTEFKKAARLVDFQKQARDIGLPEAHGEIMMKAFDGDPEAIKKHGEMIKGMAEQIRTGKVFTEFGKGGGGEGTGTSAYDQIKLKGEELRLLDPKLSPQQARTKVMENPANAELVQRHKSEETARRQGRAA